MNPNSFDGNAPSSRELLSIFFERKWGMLAIFLSTIIFTMLIVYFVLTPKFESKATLLINFSDVTRPIVGAAPKSDFEKITEFHTQKDVIKSVKIASEVVERLKLDEVRQISKLESLKIRLKELKVWLGEVFDIEKWQKPWDPEAAAILAVIDNLDIKTSPESKAIKISYRSFNPKESKETLATVIQQFEIYYYQQIQQEASGILSYIEEQIDDSRDELLSIEDRILKLRTSSAVPESTTTGTKSFSTLSITDSIDVKSEYKLYILQLEEEQRQLSQNLPVDDPRLVTLQEKITAMIATLNDLPEKELTYKRLLRLHNLAQDKYLLLAKNLEQARLITHGQAKNLGLIYLLEQPAANEKPVSPKTRLMLFMAIFLGGGLAFAWVYLSHYFDSTIRFPSEFPQNFQIRHLGSLGEIR